MKREQGRKISLVWYSGPKSIGSLFLIALFLTSALAQPIWGIGSSTPGTETRRDAETSGSGEIELTETEIPPPIEEDTPSGRDVTDLGHLLSSRLSRVGSGVHLRAAAFPQYARIEAIVQHRPHFESSNPSPRASGRSLRHWLQSQTC